MSDLSVVRVENAKTRRQFLNSPIAIFGRQTFPRLSKKEVASLAGLESFSYYTPSVEHDAFVALHNNRCVGRIAVNIHPEQTSRHPPRAAFFGCYESIDDSQVAKALFETASEWAIGHSAKRLVGPYSPSVNYYSGLRVNEFDQVPMYFTSWNPSWYVDQLQANGFRCQRQMLAYRTTLAEIPKLDPRIDDLIDKASQKTGLQVRFARSSSLKQDIRSVMNAYNAGLKSMWGYLPMSDEEIDEIVHWWSKTVTPQGIMLGEVDGVVVGGVLGLVDINPLLVSRINRILFRLTGSSFLRLKRKKLKMFRIVAAFVDPGYVRWGVGPAMLKQYIDHWTDFGLTEAEFSWVYENNNYSRAPLEKWGLKPIVTHRVYEKKLGPVSTTE